MAELQEYTYRIKEVLRVVDGDTYYLTLRLPEPLDLGFYINLDPTWTIECRLLGWDTPEITKGDAYERSEAKVAKSAALQFLMVGDLWIRTEKDPDNFGRWLGDIWRNTSLGEFHLGDYLNSLELASRWPTRWREEFGQPQGE